MDFSPPGIHGLVCKKSAFFTKQHKETQLVAKPVAHPNIISWWPLSLWRRVFAYMPFGI